MNKKLLLLALLVCVFGSTYASTLIQGNWRWRNNDGDENTATFKAAQNTPITITDYSELRLRIRVENESNVSDQTHSVGALKYATSANGTFVNVGSVNAAFEYVISPAAPAAKAPTTNSTFLTTTNAAGLSPFDYAAGEYFNAERDLGANEDKSPVPPSKYSDLEFVIKPTVNVQPNTTYYFLIENAKDGGMHNLATISTATVLPVEFIAFEAKPDKSSVQLRWSTAAEKNNERFEIRRSVDAKDWRLIATQKGKGNTEIISHYVQADKKPLNGVSYYQLTQFDFDGTEKVLSTQSVNLTLDPSVEVKVFPNPVSSQINVSISNYIGQHLRAALYSQDGKLLHKQELTSETQKLNINKMPPAGVYVLKVAGSNLLISKKVVVL